MIRSRPRDGVIPEGSIPNLQRQATLEPFVDFLRSCEAWRAVQRGEDDPSGSDPLECAAPGSVQGRFIRNLRDLGNWVHLDDPAQHFRNAALLMLNEPALAPGPTTDDIRDEDAVRNADPVRGGRTALDSFPFGRASMPERPFSFAPCNPYVAPRLDSDTQIGFVTFGPAHVLDAIGEVTDLALRAAWWHKWHVHRRARPEQFGGLLDGWLRNRRLYQIDELPRDFTNTGGVAGPMKVLDLIRIRNRFIDDARLGGAVPGADTYLLPQLFPEGSPTHPSYPSGHATIAGACATLLKAFFDTKRPMTDPKAEVGHGPDQLPPAFVACDDGLNLEEAAENGVALTTGGELDKLASNISIGRNAAGVHWRSDATQGMELGEAVCAYFLHELAWALNEEVFCFTFRRFFRPKVVTISRRTEYHSGQETRFVGWSIQTVNAEGERVGDPEVLERTWTIARP